MKPLYTKLLIFLGVLFSLYMAYRFSQGVAPVKNNLEFPPSLSSFGLFAGKMSNLTPANGTEMLELSATLFTDYAEKQRLIRLPTGTQMIARGPGLPEFPTGTLIAKTFYYSLDNNLPAAGKKIIETRLLLFSDSKWNAATYQWNATQTDAYLVTDGATVPITIPGREPFRYHIPAAAECSGCHRSGDALIPIGPKLQNLNRTVYRNGKSLNQLAYLHAAQLLSADISGSTLKIPDDKDTTCSLAQRARAYLEMNCAHCHNPQGWASSSNLHLAYEVPYEKTGIALSKWNILSRMETMGTYHMPKLGTTLLHREGIDLVRKYLQSQEKKKTE